MKKLVTLFAALFSFAAVFAEPMKMASKAELSAAKKAAEGLLSSGVSADQVLQYAEEAKKSAEKYQLYCAAFKLYAKEEKAEEAAKVINTIQSEFIDAPDKDIVSMIEQHAKKLAKDNEELGAALSVSKMRASAASQLSKAKKELKKNPNSVDYKYLIAEAYAVLGDWKSALKQFKDAGGSVWQIANEESSGIISAKTAAFWWDYKPRSKFNAEPAFKAHSAALYEKLLKDGELSVLEKATAESRIEQAGKLGATKPKSELDKLKKICNIKGLVHCWRFNGDLKDCIGETESVLEGDMRLIDKQIESTRGKFCCVPLGSHVIAPDSTEFTIEFWCSTQNVGHNAFLFSLENSHSERFFCYTWSGSIDCQFATNDRGIIIKQPFGIFPTQRECHLAIVGKKNGSTWEIATYRQDNVNGETEYSDRTTLTNNWSPSLCAGGGFLGSSHVHRSKSESMTFNEFRIWNRALPEEELTQNAIKFHKAGETMKK